MHTRTCEQCAQEASSAIQLQTLSAVATAPSLKSKLLVHFLFCAVAFFYDSFYCLVFAADRSVFTVWETTVLRDTGVTGNVSPLGLSEK